MTEVRSAAAFRRPTEMLALPSGKEVEVRKPDVAALIMANADKGIIPQPLVDQMVAQLNQNPDGNKQMVFEAAHLPGLYEFNMLMTKAAVVWPVIVPDGQEPDYEAGECALVDLDTDDRAAITNWVMKAANVAGRFHQGQVAGMGTAQPGRTVRNKAKRTAGARR